MGRYAQPQDNTIATLATRLAETVADAMDRAGVALSIANTGALIRLLTKDLERVGHERERAVRQGRIDRRTAWVQEHGLLSPGETGQLLGLTVAEMVTARDLAFITPVAIPLDLRATSEHFTAESWQYYAPGVLLTDAQRARIAHETLLTRTQAADRLGLPLPTFDHLRLAHALTPVEQVRGGARPMLYRTDDVDRLAAAPRPDDISRQQDTA